MPTYGEAKAALHSYTESLRPQLAGMGIEVTELVPPAVATPAMAKLNPTSREIVVKGALPLHWAERDGTYAELLPCRPAQCRQGV
jgi:uncharacterized oxidoreductase